MPLRRCVSALTLIVCFISRSTTQPIPECGRYVEGSIPYDVLRKPYNMAISPNEYKPKVIWLACTEDSVLEALREAVQTKAEISVRSGGHNVEGYSTYAPAGSLKPRILIDVYHLKTKTFQNPQATFGAGIKVIEANEFLAKQNPVVSLPLTECGTVGITGSALGGGYGMLSRKQGLTADNIVSMRVALIQNNVPAVVDVSATSNPELFWALRGGGGGNFGVVTQITFKTHQIPPTVTTFKGTAPLGTARQLAQFITAAPQELFFSITVDKPGASALLTLDGVYLGDMPATMETQLNSLASDSTVTAKMIFNRFTPDRSRDWGRPMNFCESEADCLEQARNVPFIQKKYFKRKAVFLHSIDEAVRVIELMKTEVSDIGFIDLTPFNGQIAAVTPTDTAFVHRDALFLLMLFKFWEKDILDPAPLNAGMKRFHDKVRAITTRKTAYPNFIDRDHLNEDWMTIFYGQNAARLKTVKARYDPQNYFQFPMSIPVTATTSTGGWTPVPAPQPGPQTGQNPPVSSPTWIAARPGSTSPTWNNLPSTSGTTKPIMHARELYKPLRGLNGQTYTLSQLIPQSQGQTPNIQLPQQTPAFQYNNLNTGRNYWPQTSAVNSGFMPWGWQNRVAMRSLPLTDKQKGRAERLRALSKRL